MTVNLERQQILPTQLRQIRLDALNLNQKAGQTQLLQDISLSILPQEFVAIVGASGAGKTTLLNALCGFRPAAKGRVFINGQDLYTNLDAYRSTLGYVPQETIIHRALTVTQALRFAAQLRLPAHFTAAARQDRIDQVLNELELNHRCQAAIHTLSGGERKRVSIGVELLTQPSLFFLDEATSGLDPGMETQMMQLLHRLAHQGRTVVLITHATKNVMLCDMVAFLTRGGRLAFWGPPTEALTYFGVDDFDQIYLQLEADINLPVTSELWHQRYQASEAYQAYVCHRQQDLSRQSIQADLVPQDLNPTGLTQGDNRANRGADPSAQYPWLKLLPGRPSRRRRTAPVSDHRRTLSPISGWQQWWVLTRRNLTILRRDRASLALMLLIAPMLGMTDFILWDRALFDGTQGNPTDALTMLFFSVLVAVLVGSLATMREMVREVDIYRRERMIGLKLLPYLSSKVALVVVLALYQAAIFLVMKLTAVDIPVDTGAAWGMYITLFLVTWAGMVMGLLVSALAPNANVAPLLIILFIVPQITFSGMLVPLDSLGLLGHNISQLTITRWGYEAMVTLSGMGQDIAADPCWQQSAVEREALSELQKAQCHCLGPNLFNQCNFPGLRQKYDPAVSQSEPRQPAEPGPHPEFNSRIDDVQAKLDRYGDRVAAYTKALDNWQESYGQWKERRERAIAAGEAIIRRYAKTDGLGHPVSLPSHWGRLGLLILGMLVLLILMQKRQDAV